MVQLFGRRVVDPGATEAAGGRAYAISVLSELVAELSGECDWENDTLVRYLDAFGALLGSIDNSYKNAGREVPSDPWVILADALRGARYYE